MPCITSALVLLFALAGSVAAQQSNIDATLDQAWSENAGWTSWHDANAGSQGVVLKLRFLRGFAWAENLGWLNLGDGTPTNGIAYGNAEGDDCGVNLDLATGFLSGLAWGENVGWINFSMSSIGADRASFDPSSHSFAGFAWSENVGWINLGDGGVTLAAFNPATNLGFGLAGAGGIVPELRYYGLLASGNQHVVSLRKAKPGALCAWFVGLTPNPTAFKGGLLVPLPTLITLFLVTDPNGMAAFQANSGTGSIAIDLYVQAAIADPGAAFGVSLSNAVAAHFLP